jgi:hypothetical protein
MSNNTSEIVTALTAVATSLDSINSILRTIDKSLAWYNVSVALMFCLIIMQLARIEQHFSRIT